MFEDESKDLIINKLIVLYLFYKIEIPITNNQAMKIILENKFMNYFTYQPMINDLVSGGLIDTLDVEEKSYFSITQLGKDTISFFSERIPSGIIAFIENNIMQIKNNIKNDSFISANIISENNGDFIVNCKVQEDDFMLLDLKLAVGTKTDAQIICNNFKRYAQGVYSEIIDSLMKKRN